MPCLSGRVRSGVFEGGPKGYYCFSGALKYSLVL